MFLLDFHSTIFIFISLLSGKIKITEKSKKEEEEIKSIRTRYTSTLRLLPSNGSKNYCWTTCKRWIIRIFPFICIPSFDHNSLFPFLCHKRKLLSDSDERSKFSGWIYRLDKHSGISIAINITQTAETTLKSKQNLKYFLKFLIFTFPFIVQIIRGVSTARVKAKESKITQEMGVERFVFVKVKMK